MGGTVRLAERPDWRTASDLAQDLLACRGGDVVIDASRAVEPSALVLEVILSAATQWRADGHGLCLRDPSAEFIGACAALGIDSACLSAVPRT